MDVAWEFTVIDGAIIAAAVVFLVLVSVVQYYWKKTKAPDQLDRKYIRKQWKKIEDLFSYGKEMNFKLAVIEADKVLDYVLKELNYPGDTMADRLKIASYEHRNLNSVWWAHKVRNQVVHDIKYIIKHGETKKVLGLFKKALKELRAI